MVSCSLVCLKLFFTQPVLRVSLMRAVSGVPGGRSWELLCCSDARVLLQLCECIPGTFCNAVLEPIIALYSLRAFSMASVLVVFWFSFALIFSGCKNEQSESSLFCLGYTVLCLLNSFPFLFVLSLRTRIINQGYFTGISVTFKAPFLWLLFLSMCLILLRCLQSDTCSQFKLHVIMFGRKN